MPSVKASRGPEVTGPARSSLLGITDLDPLKRDLLFERSSIR